METILKVANRLNEENKVLKEKIAKMESVLWDFKLSDEEKIERMADISLGDDKK